MTIQTYVRFLIATTLVIYHTVQGQCPFSVANRSITTCDGSSKAGSQVYIDFYKINSPCTCTVIPSISGVIYIHPEEVNLSFCTTTIIVGGSQYTCPTQRILSSHNVIANQPFTVKARYQASYNSGTFYHCLGLQQQSPNDIQVTCGSGPTTQTTTHKTTTIPETTTVDITSAQISSTGIKMTVSPNQQDNFTTVSCDLRCTKLAGNELPQMDEVSNLHLQIPLALFVVIAVVSTIFNIYFFIKLRQRNDSKCPGEQNTSREVNQSFSNQSAADAYTELDMANVSSGGRNQAYTELDIRNNTTETSTKENQYDSLSTQKNYINLNTS